MNHRSPGIRRACLSVAKLSIVKQMGSLSGLKASCRQYVGQQLVVWFEQGWGWTESNGVDCFQYEAERRVTNAWAEIIPEEFFSQGSTYTRGFLGRIFGPDRAFHGWPVMAIPMSDGLDYDFTTEICTAWRFWIGEGKFYCPEDSFPRLRGAGIIGGYGQVALSKEEIQRA